MTVIHREHRDFRVLMESFDSGCPEHTVLGRGGSIGAGDVIETTYRGNLERWTVRSITRDDTWNTWRATVLPAAPLRVVAEQAEDNVIPFPVRAVPPPSSVVPFAR